MYLLGLVCLIKFIRDELCRKTRQGGLVGFPKLKQKLSSKGSWQAHSLINSNMLAAICLVHFRLKTFEAWKHQSQEDVLAEQRTNRDHLPKLFKEVLGDTKMLF